MADDPYKYFRLEAREILDLFGAGVLELEKGANAKQMPLLLRLAHTLKGAARVVRQVEIADAAHAIEDVLTPFRNSPDTLPRDNIDAVLHQLDEIAERVSLLSGGPSRPEPRAAAAPPVAATPVQPPPAAVPNVPPGPRPPPELPPPPEPPPPVAAEPGPQPRPTAEQAQRTVRTEIAEMDALLDGIAETHALLGTLRTSLRSLDQVQRLADMVAEQLVLHRGTDSPQPGGRNPAARNPIGGTLVGGNYVGGNPGSNPAGHVETAFALADDLRREVNAIEHRLTSTVDQIDRELRQSRETAEQMRLVDAGTLVTVLERTARDAAHALTKEIEFVAQGGDIRLEADVLATVQGAMVQVVRNAVAHGIESPADRRAAGKSPAGRITLGVDRQGAHIVFTCEDDGSGVDLDAVRGAAMRRGMPAADVDRLDADQLMAMLLRGGLSTAATVTEIAGRGVGLDVVRDAVERLGGTIDVKTRPGAGAIFALAVPLSLASIEALMVEVAGSGAAIPLDAVRSTTLLGSAAISRGAGETVVHDAQIIPFLWLPGALEGGKPSVTRKWPAVIVKGSDGVAAVGVDRLLGTRRIVVRPLPELAPTVAFIAAATLDAEGNPQLVLSPEGLVAEARKAAAAEPEGTPERHPVLIVDDSLTTRMLEQSILESAGYEVDLAVSAEEALQIARQRRYALFLVDVDMPGMSGFDFVERIRADQMLRDIPAILVTSRSAPEDRQRGRDAGAQGYIVKGEFDQAELLTIIRSLVG